MAKQIFISGAHELDNLAVFANSNDPFVTVYIDYLSGTDSFTRSNIELSIDQQVALCKALYLNIKKWSEQ